MKSRRSPRRIALVEEIEERRRVQLELIQLNDELERRVEERAADVLQANLALRDSERFA